MEIPLQRPNSPARLEIPLQRPNSPARLEIPRPAENCGSIDSAVVAEHIV